MMKIVALCTLVLAVTSIQQLRQHDMEHDMPFLDSMGPLKMAQFMSGDYAAALPESIQPLARRVMGQEKQSGVSGFLGKAQNLFGSGKSSSSSKGLFGGMSDLFAGQPKK